MGVHVLGQHIMTELCHSYGHRNLPLSATRRYQWEEVRAMCKRVSPPFWLRVEGRLIPIQNEGELRMACKVSAAYHDWVAYNALEDDGFSEDMAEREARIAAEMEEPDDC
jgi:hypothetical protein